MALRSPLEDLELLLLQAGWGGVTYSLVAEQLHRYRLSLWLQIRSLTHYIELC